MRVDCACGSVRVGYGVYGVGFRMVCMVCVVCGVRVRLTLMPVVCPHLLAAATSQDIPKMGKVAWKDQHTKTLTAWYRGFFFLSGVNGFTVERYAK